MSGTSYFGKATSVPDLGLAFHTYALEWTHGALDFYVDDTQFLHIPRPEVATEENWPAWGMYSGWMMW